MGEHGMVNGGQLEQRRWSPGPRTGVPGERVLQRSRVPECLRLLVEGNREFGQACIEVGRRHAADIELGWGMATLVEIARQSVRQLTPLLRRYEELAGERADARLRLPAVRAGRPDPQEDLHDLYVLHAELEVALTILAHAARALHDQQLVQACRGLEARSRERRDWLQAHLGPRGWTSH